MLIWWHIRVRKFAKRSLQYTIQYTTWASVPSSICCNGSIRHPKSTWDKASSTSGALMVFLFRLVAMVVAWLLTYSMNTAAARANAVFASFDTTTFGGNTSFAIRVMAVTGKFKSSRRSAIATRRRPH